MIGIIHYCVNEKSNKMLNNENIFLLDAGNQYLDGTTDMTRTISINSKPTSEQKNHYTRVLKGHISIATCYFPQGTTGAQLDILARQYLWEIGCDYAHGTGHGVGSFLSCHEGPQNISPTPNPTPLLPGMILSNEPGYYKNNQYGIRIENLMLVTKAKPELCIEREMFCFETLTLIPIDKQLIDLSLLNEFEKRWLNNYHNRVYDKIKPHLSNEDQIWLKKATTSIN